MTIGATLNGNRVIDARLTIPGWGASWHDVTLDSEATLTGPVTLTIADLTIACSVISGGSSNGRSYYRLVSGAAGWGKTIPAKAYAADNGVKLSTVLTDAAAEAGEKLDPSTVDQVKRLGPAWTRPEDPAGRVLELLAPAAWYVGEDGFTRLGARAPSVPPSTFVSTTVVDRARGTVTIASDSIAWILPGLAVSGLTVADVEHTFDAKGGLRSKVWGKQAGGASRRLAAWRRLFEALDPDRAFRGVYEYRIGAQNGNRLDLQPVRTSAGMPTLLRVPVRPGVAGCKGVYALGSRVVVGFLDADPARPVVLAFDEPDADGFLPTSLTIVGGSAGAARSGDEVTITQAQLTTAGAAAGGNPVSISSPLKCSITGASSKVKIG